MRVSRSIFLGVLAFAGVIHAQSLQITSTSPLPPATVGVPYKFTFQASGTTLPLSWFISHTDIPTGLAFDEVTGILSGTPAVDGAYTFNVNLVSLSGFQQVADTANKTFTLVVSVPGKISVAPTALAFNALIGGEQPPSQVVAVAVSSGGQSGFTVSIDGGTPGTTAPWLSAVPAVGGATPGRLLVSVDSTKVQATPASLTGRIRVVGAGTTTPIDVPVTFILTTAPAKLSVSPTTMRFTKVNPEEILVVHNAGGGGPLNFTATVNGSNSFITSVTPSSGVTPAVLRVRVNVGAPGAFRDSIHIATSAGNVDVPVSLFVPNPGPVLSVSQTGFRLQTTQGTGTSNTDIIRILNIGDSGTSVNWTAELLAGSDWLVLGSTSGTATVSAASKLVLKTGPGAATETPGGHYALVRITAPGAQESPQYIVGVLDVGTAGAGAVPDPTLEGYFFTGVALGVQPISQTLTVGTSSAAAVKVVAAASTSDGARWLSVSAVNDSASSAQAAQFTISASTTGLKAGIYRGEIDLVIQNALRVVNVTLVVAPAGTVLPSIGKPESRGATGCVATQLALTETGQVNNFSIPAGWPSTLEMQLNDDCGAPVTNGTVVASFSNGDPPITLLGDGQSPFYSATWQPGTPGPSVAVTLNANAPGLAASAAQLNGGVNTNANPAPSLVIDGLLHNINPVVGAPLAPGTVSQVYGTGLTTAASSPSSVPLPVQFKGVQVLVGGLNAPLYYISPTQLTVQIPSELTATNEYQALIAVNGAYTLPQPVDVVPVAPGVVAFADGALVAQHASDYSLVDSTKPAKPGEALIIYLVGLGATSENIPSGTAAPLDRLVTVTNAVTVTIDGQPAQSAFTGLTPGGVGLYQINLTVPTGAKAGKLPVVITQAGIATNATTLLVQP